MQEGREKPKKNATADLEGEFYFQIEGGELQSLLPGPIFFGLGGMIIGTTNTVYTWKIDLILKILKMDKD